MRSDMRIPRETFSYLPAPGGDHRRRCVHHPLGASGHPAGATCQSATPGEWALPGGFLDIDEDLDTCAARELAEETGLRDVFPLSSSTPLAPPIGTRERVISVTYYALILRIRSPLRARRATPPSAGTRSTHCHRSRSITTTRSSPWRTAAGVSFDYSTIAFQFMPRPSRSANCSASTKPYSTSPRQSVIFRKRILSRWT